MKKSFQKQIFKALAKKVSILSTTEKGQLRGGFSSVSLTPAQGVGANGKDCIC